MTDQLWQAVLGEIEVSISRASFATWFKNTRLLEKSESKVVIAVPNVFTKQQLQDKFHTQILTTLKKNGLAPKKVEYKISAEANGKDKKEAQQFQSQAATALDPQATGLSAGPSANIDHVYDHPTLNAKYTFDNFVVGSGSELAYAASQAIVKNPGMKYNPLFVYGGVGLGKTHLIQAIGNEILAKNSDMSVIYITCESFTNEFVDSIRRKNNFANKYRSADVLIIDDMQFIAGKEKTQEEFFHTFNSLHQSNKQLIISSDKPPKAIPTLEERLRSRFEWGMIADISPPDFETRMAILQQKSAHGELGGVEIPDDTIEFLAKQYQTNVRELEGALIKLLAYCELRNIQPNVEAAGALLGKRASRPKRVTATQVVNKTAGYFNLEVDELCGPKRDRDIVVPRQIAMYLMRSELHMSYPKIAKSVGRKDHTTAIHSVDKIEKKKAEDHNIRQYVTDLRERIYA